MRILILTQWYSPEPTLLIHELAKTLIEFGHSVEVLTGFPNYPSGRLYSGYRIRFCQRETVDGVPVTRVPLYPNHSRSSTRRAANYLSFSLSAACLGSFVVSEPDVIFAYHPPLTVGFPASVLSARWRVPFVYQIQDMWPETLSATGMLSDRRILRGIEWYARRVYQQASALCVISPGFRKNLLSKGVPEEKVHVIPNWVDNQTYQPRPRNSELGGRLGLSEHFNVMFAGNIGEAQGLMTVLTAAELLQDLPKVQFVFVGDGVALPRLTEVARSKGLENMVFLGRYPASEMPELYAWADALLVHLRDDPLFQITIPHKVLAYMASGKPILAAVAGDAADMVIQARAGVACPPGKPEALAFSVRGLYAMTEEERLSMGAAGLDAARTQYDRQTLVGKIETVLNAVVREHRLTG